MPATLYDRYERFKPGTFFQTLSFRARRTSNIYDLLLSLPPIPASRPSPLSIFTSLRTPSDPRRLATSKTQIKSSGTRQPGTPIYAVPPSQPYSHTIPRTVLSRMCTNLDPESPPAFGRTFSNSTQIEKKGKRRTVLKFPISYTALLIPPIAGTLLPYDEPATCVHPRSMKATPNYHHTVDDGRGCRVGLPPPPPPQAPTDWQQVKSANRRGSRA
ncbi:hypothetical protein FPV67DRAFT_1670160 [Lyophyllum atratum]|nr:hypothetical protein FPV67DRAFT_1670160 [Lyophyllum atratum]